jgi:hypothetical protein
MTPPGMSQQPERRSEQTASVVQQQVLTDVAVLQEQMRSFGRDLGDLKRTTSEQMAKVERSNEAQNGKLDTITAQLNEARGGLRTMLWFAGAMATFGGAIVWVIERLVGARS